LKPRSKILRYTEEKEVHAKQQNYFILVDNSSHSVRLRFAHNTPQDDITPIFVQGVCTRFISQEAAPVFVKL
jgi:hypothetical protein